MSRKQARTRRRAEEQAFLANYDASHFPHPSVAVDLALITVQESRLHVLLLRRDEHPYKGDWALPGGFVGISESLEAAVTRVLKAKAGLEDVFTEQLYTFGDVERDPRTRVIAVTYYGLVDPERLAAALHGGETLQLAALEVPWDGLEGAPVHALGSDGAALPLAFDHARMLGICVQRLRGKLDYAPIGFELLPERFTLRRLQDVQESVLGHSVNKDSFRRRMLATGLILATGKREQGALHRPAELFRFSNPARE